MRIVIVGAGISGLASYLFLKKYLPLSVQTGSGFEIIILENHRATKRVARSEPSANEGSGRVSNIIGAALGLAPNGLSVIRDLDRSLFGEVVNSGYPISHFLLASAYGWPLARLGATNQSEPELHSVLISRQRLWDSLREHVPDHVIRENQKVLSVTHNKSRKPLVKFLDGYPDLEADLIIGADGAKSAVKKAVTGDGSVDNHPAYFDGLIGVGGFIPSSLLPKNESRGRMTVTFGSHGFFGYGACTVAPQSNHFAKCTAPVGDEATWWSTYETTELPDTRNFDSEEILQQLRRRQLNWKDPVIQKIVAQAQIDSIYPTWLTPDLPTWYARGLVIVGDAAHAMQPSSGQGASQALEDAQVLSMLLAHQLGQFRSRAADVGTKSAGPESESEAIDLATKQYFELRQPRVKRIMDRAKQMGDAKRKKGLVEEWLTYLILWIIGKFPMDSLTKEVYNEPSGHTAKVLIEKDCIRTGDYSTLL